MSQTNPIAHVVPNPVLLDKEIAAIQAQMATLSWLEVSFGRAFKQFKIVNGTKVSFPAIFQELGKDYYNAFPNDNIISHSFVFVDPEQITEWNTKRLHDIEHDISIIVFFDLERIDNTLTYRFTEKLKEDVIFVLSNLRPNTLRVNNITDDVEEAFNDFSISEIKAEFLKLRYGAFKFDCTIFYANNNCALNTYTP